MSKRELRRDETAIDASLSCLVGDGANAKDVLFKIRIGELKGSAAKDALAAARYADWKSANA